MLQLSIQVFLEFTHGINGQKSTDRYMSGFKTRGIYGHRQLSINFFYRAAGSNVTHEPTVRVTFKLEQAPKAPSHALRLFLMKLRHNHELGHNMNLSNTLIRFP